MNAKVLQSVLATMMMMASGLVAIAAHADDPAAAGPLSESRQAESVAGSLTPWRSAHFDASTPGAQSPAAEGEIAVGPQYPLNDRVALGGMNGRGDTDRFGIDARNEHYTFGLRLIF